MIRRLVLALVVSGLAAWQAGAAEPVQVFAAGSLIPPFTDMAKAFDAPGDSIKLVFGPSGVLRERIETGEPADILGYCSNVDAMLQEVPGLVSVPLAPPLAPEGAERPVYGMVVLSDSPVARRFAAFVLSPAGQGILAKYGFEPIAAP